MSNSFKKYFTRETDNIGQRVQIPGGDDWIQVLGPSSDRFRRAQGLMRRKVIEFIQAKGENARNTPEFTSLIDEETKNLRVAQIGSWSFDEPVSEENVKLLFLEAPDIEALVDSVSGKRQTLAQPSPTSSESSQSSSSSSTDQ